MFSGAYEISEVSSRLLENGLFRGVEGGVHSFQHILRLYQWLPQVGGGLGTR